ncbi:winged helix-turn-helix domain-containing protein [Acinetobacter brisouii]|uniref:winged helix-turn-helix domain-containing protein n=1 Tax=Acinetobacter brisouii TaxID=396323 RepID=UPI00124DB239|nr:winged helix-turn-helix domain-containing protein [Acinetobacter brisouii]
MTTEKKTQPKPKQWAEAEALWELGETTREEIANKLGVSQTAVSMHMKKHNIERGSRADEHRKKIAEDVTEAATSDATIHAARIRETKDEHYQMAQHIAKLTWHEILTARKDKSPFASITPNLKALETAMNVLQKARVERWAVLGLDRPDAVDINELPDLVIEELTAEQIEALRSRDFNDFEEVEAVEQPEETELPQN